MAKPLRISQDADLRRQRAYPPVGDQLDAIGKALAAIRASKVVTLPPETTAWLDALQAVKDRVPKPPKPTPPGKT